MKCYKYHTQHSAKHAMHVDVVRMEDECYCAISWIQNVHFMVDSHYYYQNNLSLPFSLEVINFMHSYDRIYNRYCSVCSVMVGRGLVFD